MKLLISGDSEFLQHPSFPEGDPEICLAKVVPEHPEKLILGGEGEHLLTDEEVMEFREHLYQWCKTGSLRV